MTVPGVPFKGQGEDLMWSAVCAGPHPVVPPVLAQLPQGGVGALLVHLLPGLGCLGHLPEAKARRGGLKPGGPLLINF